MLSCIWTTSNKSERLMHLVGWFIWMYDEDINCTVNKCTVVHFALYTITLQSGSHFTICIFHMLHSTALFSMHMIIIVKYSILIYMVHFSGQLNRKSYDFITADLFRHIICNYILILTTLKMAIWVAETCRWLLRTLKWMCCYLQKLFI